MKTDGKMSYKNFIFPVNPYVIHISHQRNITEHKIPFEQNIISDMGENARIITGEGEFFGTDCISDFHRLENVFHSNGGGMLYIPSQKPVYAVFDKLELIAQDTENVVKYTFRFIESFDKNKNSVSEMCISDGVKCLWDYAYEYGIDIETLVKANPDILRPDISITHGKAVNLC